MGMACSLVQKGNLAPAVPASESETGSMACSLVQKEFWAPAVPASESETGSMACSLVQKEAWAPASSRLQAARTHQRSCGQDVA